MPKGAFEFQGDDDLRFLRDELYEGSWELMLADLEARLAMRPAVFKITENIREDIAAIKRLMADGGNADTDVEVTDNVKPAKVDGSATPLKKKATTNKKKAASSRQSARKTSKSGRSSSGGKKRGKSA